jgi:hypothetical protein
MVRILLDAHHESHSPSILAHQAPVANVAPFEHVVQLAQVTPRKAYDHAVVYDGHEHDCPPFRATPDDVHMQRSRATRSQLWFRPSHRALSLISEVLLRVGPASPPRDDDEMKADVARKASEEVTDVRSPVVWCVF